MSTAGRTAIAGNCGRTGRNQTHGSVAAHGLALPSNGQCPPQTPQWRACRTEYFWTRPDEEASPSQASPQRQRRSPWAATVSNQLEEGQRLPCRTSSVFARSADFPPCVVGELNYLETVHHNHAISRDLVRQKSHEIASPEGRPQKSRLQTVQIAGDFAADCTYLPTYLLACSLS